MSLKKSGLIPVEVDMVPLIDIVSLLLMFLVMVGDMARSATNVKMKLPRADQAVKDDVDTEGRIVVQLQPKNGRYWAVIENHWYELVRNGDNRTLTTYLEDQIARRKISGMQTGSEGQIKFPVKLRIPAEAPMFEVERVVMSLAQARLVNVQYAAEKAKE